MNGATASNLTSLTMTGELAGGTGSGSGLLNIGNAGTLIIGSSKTVTTATLTNAIAGGSGESSGGIQAVGNLNNVQVLGTIQGGSAVYESGYVHAENIVSMTVAGAPGESSWRVNERPNIGGMPSRGMMPSVTSRASRRSGSATPVMLTAS